MSSSFEVPVTLIKQYVFCPRIPYFVLVLGYKERITENMLEGLKYHAKRTKGVYLRSEKLGIHGFVDEIIECGGYYKVVEYKSVKFNKKTLKQHLYQAVAYALLVEENFGRVLSVVLKYKNRELEFPVTRELKDYVKRVISRIKKIAKDGVPPQARIDARKCRNCGYIRICRFA